MAANVAPCLVVRAGLPSLPVTKNRVFGIAVDGSAKGDALCAWAAASLLRPGDSVYVLHGSKHGAAPAEAELFSEKSGGAESGSAAAVTSAATTPATTPAHEASHALEGAPSLPSAHPLSPSSASRAGVTDSAEAGAEALRAAWRTEVARSEGNPPGAADAVEDAGSQRACAPFPLPASFPHFFLIPPPPRTFPSPHQSPSRPSRYSPAAWARRWWPGPPRGARRSSSSARAAPPTQASTQQAAAARAVATWCPRPFPAAATCRA